MRAPRSQGYGLVDPLCRRVRGNLGRGTAESTRLDEISKRRRESREGRRRIPTSFRQTPMQVACMRGRLLKEQLGAWVAEEDRLACGAASFLGNNITTPSARRTNQQRSGRVEFCDCISTSNPSIHYIPPTPTTVFLLRLAPQPTSLILYN